MTCWKAIAYRLEQLETGQLKEADGKQPGAAGTNVQQPPRPPAGTGAQKQPQPGQPGNQAGTQPDKKTGPDAAKKKQLPHYSWWWALPAGAALLYLLKDYIWGED